jgi:hypothetical protein
VPDDVLGVLLVQALATRRQWHVAEPEREHSSQVADDAEGGADVVLGDDDVAHERDPDAERLGGQPHVLDRGPDADHLQAEAHQRAGQRRAGSAYQPASAVAEQAAVLHEDRRRHLAQHLRRLMHGRDVGSPWPACGRIVRHVLVHPLGLLDRVGQRAQRRVVGDDVHPPRLSVFGRRGGQPAANDLPQDGAGDRLAVEPFPDAAPGEHRGDDLRPHLVIKRGVQPRHGVFLPALSWTRCSRQGAVQ